MQQTVVGVFDSASEAQAAREQLIQAGFPTANVQAHSHQDAAVSQQTSTAGTQDGDDGFMAGVSRFFRGMFGDEDEHAGHYSEAVRRGGSVVSVTVEQESQVDMARQVLASAGAVDIEKRAAAWRQDGYQQYDSTARLYNQEQLTAERGKVLPVVREELEVGKREVDLGAVRVHSRTVERPVQESIELREQHAQIERRPVDRPATSADLAALDSGASIEVRESAERAVVSKAARVVEEVTVGSQATTRTETINDSLRSTEVEVDKTGGNSAAMQGEQIDETGPAYQYGSQLRSNSQYANKSWDEIESDVQTDWGGLHSDHPWERASPAIRRGWNSGSATR